MSGGPGLGGLFPLLRSAAAAEIAKALASSGPVAAFVEGQAAPSQTAIGPHGPAQVSAPQGTLLGRPEQSVPRAPQHFGLAGLAPPSVALHAAASVGFMGAVPEAGSMPLPKTPAMQTGASPAPPHSETKASGVQGPVSTAAQPVRRDGEVRVGLSQAGVDGPNSAAVQSPGFGADQSSQTSAAPVRLGQEPRALGMPMQGPEVGHSSKRNGQGDGGRIATTQAVRLPEGSGPQLVPDKEPSLPLSRAPLAAGQAAQGATDPARQTAPSPPENAVTDRPSPNSRPLATEIHPTQQHATGGLGASSPLRQNAEAATSLVHPATLGSEPPAAEVSSVRHAATAVAHFDGQVTTWSLQAALPAAISEAGVTGAFPFTLAGQTASAASLLIFNASMIPTWPPALRLDEASQGQVSIQMAGASLAQMTPEEAAEYLAKMAQAFGFLLVVKKRLAKSLKEEKETILGLFAFLGVAMDALTRGLQMALNLTIEQQQMLEEVLVEQGTKPKGGRQRLNL